jgi:DNA-directed RNA polymerase subunit F
MSEGKVLKMEPVSLQEVKEILKERKGEKELTYEQDITYKYIEKYAKLTDKQTKDLLEKLDEIEFLKTNKELKYQLLTALPTHIEQVKLFLPKDVTASDEELSKIVDLTKKYGEKL